MKTGVETSPNREGADVIPISGLLLAFVLTVYLVTFGGRFVTVDEAAIETLSASLAKRGATDSNRLLWTFNAMELGPNVQRGAGGDYYLVKGPLTSLLAVPLYWLALRVPALLPVPTIMVLNVVLTALTAVVVFWTGFRWGFSPRAAAVAALAFAFATLAWPYSKTFHAEPAAAFGLALAAYAFTAPVQGKPFAPGRSAVRPPEAASEALAGSEGKNLSNGLSVPSAALGGLGLILACVAVYPTAVVVPVFGAYLWYRARNTLPAHKPPASMFQPGWTRPAKDLTPPIARSRTSPAKAWTWLVAAALPFFAGAALAGWYNTVRFGAPWNVGFALGRQGFGSFRWDSCLTALFGLTLSPYRGLAWFVPLSLLAPLGFVWLWRRGRRAEAGLALGALSAELLFHSLWSGWWGGQGWGPRYLVPVMPLLSLLLLPLFARCAWPRRWIAWPLVLLFVVSLGISAFGATFYYQPYEDVLAARFQALLVAGAPLWKLPLLTQPGYFTPWAMLRGATPLVPLLGWIRPASVDWFSLLVLVLVGLVTGGLLARQLARPGLPRWTGAAGGLLGLAALLAVMPRYSKNIAETQAYSSEPFARIASQARRGDSLALLMTGHYFELGNVLRMNLPDYGFSRDADVLHAHSREALENIAARSQRVWLVTEGIGPADPQNQIEAWLAGHAFQASDQWIGTPGVRVTLYGFSSRPPRPLSAAPTRAAFARGITLVAAEAPAGPVAAGEVAPVTLVWQTASPQTKPLQVFLHLIDAQGTLVAQHDGQPGAGYRPVTGWAVGEQVRDQHGIWLPDNLAAGQYELYVGLYDPQTGQRLQLSASANAADSFRLGQISVVTR